MAIEDEHAVTADGQAVNVQRFQGGVLGNGGGTPDIFVVYRSIYGLYQTLGEWAG